MTIDNSFQEESKICYTDDMAKGVTTGTFDFEVIRQADILYVDKTKYLYKLVSRPENRRCFVSRPRRFGKSLCVNTLEKIFQGRKDLFEGLYISQTDYDWKKYPVIRFSFGSCSAKNGTQLNEWILGKLLDIAEGYGIELIRKKYAGDAFSELIEKISDKYGQIVVLFDEYEMVITDNIYNENIEEMRDVLSSFYQVLKDMDSYIHFVFITGVTKYTKLSLFSKLNNLRDISMDSEYAEMFGYTQEELEHYFAEHIEEKMAINGMDRETLLAGVKKQYNGYRFSPNAKTVYNPVSVGSFMSSSNVGFDNYWIDTGGRLTMLYDIADESSFDITRDMLEPVFKDDFSTFDIIDISRGNVDEVFFKCLMYQLGYLTIQKGEMISDALVLDFPNQEVSRAYSYGYMKRIFAKASMYTRCRYRLTESIYYGDMAKAIEAMKGVFAGIPALVYNNALKSNEYYYQSLVYMMMTTVGASVNLEEITSGGRIDAVAENKDTVFIIEFKLDKSARDALSQIRANHYADKFLSKGKKIKLIGINFSSKERNIDDYLVEEL